MIIDAHMHLIRKENFDKERYQWLDNWRIPENMDLDEPVRMWKDMGIEKVVAMGQAMYRIWNTDMGENYIQEAYDRYPDFIIPFASVEPIDKINRFNQAAFDKFEDDVLNGRIRGVLFTPPCGHYNANDKTVYPFYQLAQKHGIVVQYHHSAMSECPPYFAPMKYYRPEHLSDVMMDFPKMKIVVEHMGYPHTEQLFILMANSDRMYTDLSMAYDREMTIAWNLVQAREYGVLDKIMFATDFVAPDNYPFSADPSVEIRGHIQKVRTGFNEINRRCGWPLLTEEEIEGIMYRNAARLYELEA